ncbi:MAG: c-type cytochrome [Gammaproteobacteria bacterium]
MSKHGPTFLDRYMVTIVILIGVAMLLVVFSDLFLERTQEDDQAAQAALEERIRPVGRVALDGEPKSVRATAPAPASAAEISAEPAPPAEAMPEPAPDPVAVAARDGHAIYQNACFACHLTGAGGAPITGDTAAWADRIAQGRDVLVKHAIEGFTGSAGVMLPKAGRADLSDEDVAAAVDYMINASGE